MATTQNTYTGDGTTVLFSFTFPYLETTDIKVSLNGTVTTAYTLANATTVQFNTAPANGASIRIYRDTDDSGLTATFYPGSAIRSQDLNENFTQNLYVTQEVNNNAVSIDGSNPMVSNFNFNNYKGVNLATPTVSTDASTKGYVDSVVATGAANAAAAASSASAAAASATAAANTLDVFDDRYLGAKASDPAVDNDGNALITGAMYFNTSTNRTRIYNGSVWTETGVPGSLVRWTKTAVGGQTSLSGNDNNSNALNYTPGSEQVFLNGALLTRGVDYTATTGNTITGLVALTAGDVVDVLSLNQYVFGTVPDQSVTNAKVAAGAGIDASKLAFTQAGTGAVARTIDSKLKDVISVKDFGAVGDGIADDTAAIQAAINEAMKLGKPLAIQGPGPYLISSTLQVKITRDALPTDNSPSNDIHFTDLTSAHIIGFGMPTIKANASMSSMLELIYDTNDLDIGPFYSKVEGLGFNGNGLATTGLKSNWSMHNSIEKNRFWDLYRGIEYIGYGVGIISSNVIRAVQGIYMSGGGGDTNITLNDFYPASTASSACIRIEWYGGNTKISFNTFTNEFGSTYSTYGVQLIGTTAAASEEVRDVKIVNNEFAGFTTAIRADAKTSEQNIYRCLISGNHTLPFGAYNPGQLLSAVSCRDLIVSNNFCNSLASSTATSPAFELNNCSRVSLIENNVSNYNPTPFLLSNCIDCRVSSNGFYDVGKLGAGYGVVGMYNACSGNVFTGNVVKQSSTSFAQNGIAEGTGVNSTFCLNNLFTQVSAPYYKIGAATLMRRVEYGSAIPTSSAYIQGDIVWNTGATAGGTPGWVCTTSGSPGTWKAMANLAT